MWTRCLLLHAQVKQRFTRDVFVHKAQVGDLEVGSEPRELREVREVFRGQGDEVSFLVDTNKEMWW